MIAAAHEAKDLLILPYKSVMVTMRKMEKLLIFRVTHLH